MKQQREHWGSRLGFIMAAAGSAIGLGSLWRFPYMTGQNGGGAFVLLYLIFTICLAVPAFVAELIIGRKAQRGVVTAYSDLSNHSSNWKLVGWISVLTSFLIISYYSVISGWSLNYVFMSLNNFTANRSPEEISSVFTKMVESADINLFWNAIFILCNIGVLYAGVRKGIEHWTRILTPALLFILIGLFIFSTTLDGFGDAFRFVFYPDFSKLSPSGILSALSMSLFTMSLGIGIIITYGSYMKQTEDMPKTALIVSSMSVLVSLMAALMIFPIIFTFGFEPSMGTGLVFQTMPVLFAKFPGTVVISTIFFILFVFTALTSTVSLFEVLVANLIELQSWSRARAVITTSIGVFVLGIPSALAGSGLLFANWKSIYQKNFFDTIEYITGNWFMPLGALFASIFIGWRLKKAEVHEEFLRGTKMRYILKPWFFFIRYIIPIAIIIVILNETEVVNFSAIFSK